MLQQLKLIHFLGAAQIQCNQTAGACDTGLPTIQSTDITIIFQYIFGTLGAIAVLVIVIAGLRLILSNGDPQTVARSRNTIIYAAVGLAIAVSAEVIVTYVLNLA